MKLYRAISFWGLLGRTLLLWISLCFLVIALWYLGGKLTPLGHDMAELEVRFLFFISEAKLLVLLYILCALVAAPVFLIAFFFSRLQSLGVNENGDVIFEKRFFGRSTTVPYRDLLGFRVHRSVMDENFEFSGQSAGTIATSSRFPLLPVVYRLLVIRTRGGDYRILMRDADALEFLWYYRTKLPVSPSFSLNFYPILILGMGTALIILFFFGWSYFL